MLPCPRPELLSRLLAILVNLRRIKRNERYWLHYDDRKWRAISGNTVVD